MGSLNETVMRIFETEKPETVRELIQLVQEGTGAKSSDIIKVIRKLQKDRALVIEKPTTKIEGFRSFLSSTEGLSFWITMVLVLAALTSILLFPGSGTPLAYIRYVFGFILATFLPGYCLIGVLFPRKRSIGEIERWTLTIGLSFAISALVGLFLSFTPFGLNITTVLWTQTGIVFLLALIALRRRYTVNRKAI